MRQAGIMVGALIGVACALSLALPSQAVAAKASHSMALMQCSGCHDITAAKAHKMGPPLFGIYGQKPSKASIKVAKWDAKSLDKFLADPKKVDATSKMPFKVADAKKRAEVVAALKGLK